MRGKGIAIRAKTSNMRITPAYAGKSPVITRNIPFPRDHPRLCGEKTLTKHFIRLTTGSPPPMRGKVGWLTTAAGKFGITPAYAGKREYSYDITSFYKDHPRLCGEKISHALLMMLDRGSPPPMRGKVCSSHCFILVCGITPAYAGKSTMPV